MSMTGAGKSVTQYQTKTISVFIKTLNSKQIDSMVRLAPQYREREIEVRSMISEALLRGKVEVYINVDDSTSSLSGVQQINDEALKHYIKQVTKLKEAGLIDPKSELTMESILRLPGVMQTIEEEQGEIDEAEWQAVRQAIQEAIEEVQAFRRQEGKMLRSVCSERIHRIAELLKGIDLPEKERIENIRQRLEESLEKIKPEGLDRGRLEQEMIYYIEKLDINEEKDRLTHHLNYYLESLEQEGAVGKTLGFIAQEIGREINTMGSKSNNAQMQQIVVQMKDELEQVKEQSLNIL